MFCVIKSCRDEKIGVWTGLDRSEKNLEYLTRQYSNSLAKFLKLKETGKYTGSAKQIIEEILSNFHRYSYSAEENAFDNSISIFHNEKRIVLLAENTDFNPAKYIVCGNRLVLSTINTPKLRSGIYYKVIISRESLFKEGEIIDHLSLYSMPEGLVYKSGYQWLLNERNDYTEFYDFGDSRNIMIKGEKRSGMGFAVIQKSFAHLVTEIYDFTGIFVTGSAGIKKYGNSPSKVQVILELIKE